MNNACVIVSALAALATGACDQRAAPAEAAVAGSPKAAAAPAPCTAADPALSFTRLCRSQAASLLLAAPGAPAAAPDGCAWVVDEAKIAEGLALLYRAARCEDGTARLAYVSDKPMARFDLVASPYAGTPGGIDTLAWMTQAADADAITRIARAAMNPDERDRCHTRRADMEGWPADALVVDEVPIPQADGIRSACGEFGLDEGAQTFWRLAQGTGWYFRLGQESPVVDARSFTLVKRSDAGKWVRA